MWGSGVLVTREAELEEGKNERLVHVTRVLCYRMGRWWGLTESELR